jgi:hypothetical protein
MIAYPVTKEHCNHQCVCSKPENCRPVDGCGRENCEHDTRTHPDPLALLEAWVRYESERGFKNYNHSQVVIAVCGMIDSIKSNPEAVRERGLKDEWWKE